MHFVIFKIYFEMRFICQHHIRMYNFDLFIT